MSVARDVSDDLSPGSFALGVRTIFEAEPLTFVVLLVVGAVRGLAPALAAILAGRAVDAIAQGGHRLELAVVSVAAVYGANQIIGALTFPYQEAWGLRLVGIIEQRGLRALASPPLLDHLLDADTRRAADVAVKQQWPHIGTFGVSCVYAMTWIVGALAQALVLARFSPALAVATTIVWFRAGAWTRRQDQLGIWTAIVQQRFPQYLRWFGMQNEHAAEIRLFGNADWFVDRFDRLTLDSYRDAWRRRAASARVLGPLLVALVLGNALGIAFIARAAYGGHIRVAELAVYATVFVGLSDLALPQEWTEWMLWGASRLPSLHVLEAAAASETARVTPTISAAARATSPTIRFEDVTFSYPGRPEPIIRNLNLTLEGGTSLAIVGDNGAGKTTLVRLLARLHDPSSGRITIDGISMTDLDPVEWQSGVAAVFQDSIRYPFTIGENIALRPVRDADLALLEQAARAVGSHDVIDSLPKGWDTVMSRRLRGGLDLSGGQWQRVALSRAAFALGGGARLLILDEPTANLDVRGEAELYERFVDLARGATTVLVSHRFSTVRRADRIVVLDHGCIVEDGSHEELMRRDGRYAALFRLQAQRYGQAVAK
ncbi:MAG TPA: ABC transporter ATP-binding protein [Acidimicrobiales bacterium]|nr:ABC transporter ATP-binding protein [Acidimicrobiales bacterium]